MNRKLYGNERVQDLSNSCLVCQGCHDKHSSWDQDLRKNLIKKWKIEISSQG